MSWLLGSLGVFFAGPIKSQTNPVIFWSIKEIVHPQINLLPLMSYQTCISMEYIMKGSLVQCCLDPQHLCSSEEINTVHAGLKQHYGMMTDKMIEFSFLRELSSGSSFSVIQGDFYFNFPFI